MEYGHGYFDELLRLGMSKKYVNSDECFEKYEALTNFLKFYEDRIVSLCKRYDKSIEENKEAIHNSPKRLLDFTIKNYDMLNKRNADDVRAVAITMQIIEYDKTRKKDKNLKFNLERIGLLAMYAKTILQAMPFKKEELQAFYNCDNYDFKYYRHDDYDDNYMFIDFPDL